METGITSITMQKDKSNSEAKKQKTPLQVSTTEELQNSVQEKVTPVIKGTETEHVVNDAESNGAQSIEFSESVAPEDPSALLRKLEEVQAEAEAARTQHLRAVADLENFRKRSARERQALIQFACIHLVEGLLPTLDNLKIGLEAAKKHPEAQPITEGFTMVFEQFRGVLNQSGLKEVNPAGEAFDPNRHECVAHKPSDEIPEGKVLAVTRVGYAFHERLLRPASVVVSSGPVKIDDKPTNI